MPCRASWNASICAVSAPDSINAKPNSRTRSLAALAASSDFWNSAVANPIPAATARPAIAPAGPKPSKALAAISWKLPTIDSAEPSNDAAVSLAVLFASSLKLPAPSSAFLKPCFSPSPTSSPDFLAALANSRKLSSSFSVAWSPSFTTSSRLSATSSRLSSTFFVPLRKSLTSARKFIEIPLAIGLFSFFDSFANNLDYRLYPESYGTANNFFGLSERELSFTVIR